VKLFWKNSNLCDHNPPTLQTDRQTTCDSNNAFCTKVHRAVKTEFNTKWRLNVFGASGEALRHISHVTAVQLLSLSVQFFYVFGYFGPVFRKLNAIFCEIN